MATTATFLASTHCNECQECKSSSRLFFKQKKRLTNSNPCPEGSVASIHSLQSASFSSRSYDLKISNPGGSYVYQEVKTNHGGGTCLELTDDVNIVGDQSKIEVEMTCQAFFGCRIQWDVDFECHETGVLTSNNGGGFQVLSDIDDTIVCSNPECDDGSIHECSFDNWSRYLAGSDRRLEHGEFYPGVAELVLGLSLGPNSNDDNKNNNNHIIPPKPLFLSARPREAKAILSISQHDHLNLHFEKVGRKHNFPSWGGNIDASQYGTLFDGLSHTGFGQTKARHYNILRAERPNTRFVFFGDNGQGDVCAAQSMLEASPNGQMVAIFIHLVEQQQQDALQDCEHPDGTRFQLHLPEGEQVHYHKTHSDAALWALERGLISCTSARRVYEAVADWQNCRCPSGGNASSSSKCATGSTSVSTRDETVAYCKDVALDQASLLAMMEAACQESTVTTTALTTRAYAMSSISSRVGDDPPKLASFVTETGTTSYAMNMSSTPQGVWVGLLLFTSFMATFLA